MIALRDAWPAGLLAALLFALPAMAQEQPADAQRQPSPSPETKSPRVTSMKVDWDAARAALAGFDLPPANDGTAASATSDALVQVNMTTEKLLPRIAAAGVPVLLPFDTAAFVRDPGQNAAGDTNQYFSGFGAPTLFYPGPSGYDAAFSVVPQNIPGVDIGSARPIHVQISASTLVYELDGLPLDPGEPVPQLESQFPGIRRVILENRLRYIFTRFGVPYFISILCSDGRRGGRLVSCRAADHLAVAFIKALHMVGGAPPVEPAAAPSNTVALPEQTSPDFTYYAPGDLLPGTSMAGRGGRADATAYSAIRFPMAHAPAYINSQSFMNWGNCDLTGLVRLGGRGKEAAYHCRINGLPLFNDETRNYAYPWRDNFCEHRHYEVTQCPAGMGHQGEDIRPSTCKLRDPDAGRCEPYQEDVVAVRDGMALRAPGDEALYLVVDTPIEHVRFRYLHMDPHRLDAAGLISGRLLAEGEVLGQVGDYQARERGTSYHLHFNMQVPTRWGWIYVNPYMTLVAAYERLIGGRGRIVSDSTTTASLPSGAMMEGASGAERSAKPEHDSESKSERKDLAIAAAAAPCKTYFVKGRRRRLCGSDSAESRGRGYHGVRAVDRRVSRKGERARHHAGDLRASHERLEARRNRA